MKTNQFDGIEYDTDEMRETLRAFARSYKFSSPDDAERIMRVIGIESEAKRNLLRMMASVMTLAVMAASFNDEIFERLAEYLPSKDVSAKDYPFFLFCIADVCTLTMFERVFWNNVESYSKYAERLTKIHETLAANYRLGGV